MVCIARRAVAGGCQELKTEQSVGACNHSSRLASGGMFKGVDSSHLEGPPCLPWLEFGWSLEMW
jgi:hypothetical protein